MAPLTGRIRVHVTPQIAEEMRLKRKRLQPRGSKPCGCGQAISANKNRCRHCEIVISEAA